MYLILIVKQNMVFRQLKKKKEMGVILIRLNEYKPLGSAPGERIKMRGVVLFESLKGDSKSKLGNLTYFSPRYSMTVCYIDGINC